MNTISNQTTTRTASGEASANLKGTSTNVPTGGRGVAVANAGAVRQVAQITGNMILAQLRPGTSFAGDIIDVRGNAIKVLLSGEKTLNATATDAKNLNIGDHITFNVASNDGKAVVIKPVVINHLNTNMLLRALEAAEVPASEKNQNIVRAMMEHEMPIDKNSVTEMMKKIEVFKTDNPEHIVAMEKHEIPLTQENVEQFGDYKNYEHRIMSQAESMGDDIPQMLSELVTGGDEGKAVNLAKSLVNILNESPLFQNEAVSRDSVSTNQPNTTQTTEQVQVANETQQMPADEKLSDSDLQFLKSMGLMEDGVVFESDLPEQNPKQQLNVEQIMHNLDSLKGDELKKFLDSDDFKDFIKDKIEKSFELNINKLGADGEETKELVKKLYENLNKKTEAMLQLLNNAGEGQSKLAHTALNMRNNMQFMQDLSQMASYIQLPVKFNENKAHGELYVYNRKKGMPVDKDVITAFLHLDLDHLGATDINVRMEKKSVMTQFSLSDEESMLIVEENLPMLKERLEKKGYVATFTVDTAAGVADGNPFDKVLETDKPQVSIKRYSFDVRA